MYSEETLLLFSQLDWYLCFVSVLVAACYLLSYKLMPAIMPGEPKVTPLEFFLGSSCLKYVRHPGDPPTTDDDFPDGSETTDSYDLHDMTEVMKKAWNPEMKASLARNSVWHILPWWLYTMVMNGVDRYLGFISTSYTYVVMLHLLAGDTVPEFGAYAIKLMILGFIVAVGKESVLNWCRLVLALRGTDPIYLGLSIMIVQKLQRLSAAGALQTNSAEAQQVAQECYYIAVNFWASPLSTCLMDLMLGIVSFRKLYHSLGITGIALTAICILLCQAVGWVCDNMKKDLDQNCFNATVKRQTTLNAILDNFRELRIYDWMRRMAKPMDDVRDTLFRNILKSSLISAVSMVFNSQVDCIVTVLTCYFMVFVRKQRVDFTEAQTARAYMGSLMASLMYLTACRWSYIDMVQRAGRIEKFMRLPEVDTESFKIGPLEVKDATFAYVVPPPKDKPKDPPTMQPVLKELNFKPNDGELVLVCGAIGSGKSSLLQALLGEMPLLSGDRTAPDTAIAYQPQVPYLIEGSIRENVLFGLRDHESNEKFVKQALAAAQLAVDINDPGSTLHSKGELTNVGKRGTHLSGGQRARTALARTVYAVLEGAKIALLDDPVSSVDNEVVQACWEGAILGAMKGATRVVVVNSQLLERLAGSADRLLVLSEGKIVYNGPPAEAFNDQEILSKALAGKYELMNKKPEKVYTWLNAGLAAVKDFAAMFGNPQEGDVFSQDHLNTVKNMSPDATFESLASENFIKLADPEELAQAKPQAVVAAEGPGEDEEEANGEDAALGLADMLRESEPMREFLRCTIPNPEEGEDQPLAVSEAPLKLSPDEWEDLRLKLRRIERQYQHKELQGKPKMTLFQLVIHFLIVARFIFFFCMLMNTFNNFKDTLLLAVIKGWSERGDEESDWKYLTQLILVFVGFSCLTAFILVVDGYGSTRLSLYLMGRVDETLTALGLPFFWRKKNLAEPQLRKVVNQDTAAMSNIARMPMMCIECLILISLTSIQTPLLWVLMPISFFGYYKMSFLPDWRNLQMQPVRERLQNGAWAKVVEMWDVLPAVRGLRRQKEFERMTHKGLLVVGYTNFMSFQLEVLCAFCHHTIGATFNAVALAVLIRMRNSGSTPTVAFAFWNLASNFSAKLNQLVGMYMPYREILKQYDQMEDIFCSDTLENTEGAVAPAGFAADGKIEFESVTFRYVAYLPPALQDVSLVVNPGENMGVVGKTGSGKSTLVSLLLRLGPLRGVPPNSGGRVLLDGVDISTLRLSDLRSKFGVVPQEPTLFSMTLKENVGDEFTDAEVLTALQWCGLDARQITGKEDGPVADALAAPLRSGSLSVGQQQLLMAARALVRRPKVLILDECTASLDRESADRLLEVLSSRSKGVTVLAIAHRLRFVLKSDRILVLSMGKVVACDTPAKLLEQPDSYFSVNLRYEQQEEPSSPTAASG